MLDWVSPSSLHTGLAYAGRSSSPQAAVNHSLLFAYGFLFFAGIWVNIHLFQLYQNRPEYRRRAIRRMLWRPWNWRDATHLILLMCASLLAGSSLARGLEGWGWIDLEAQPFALILIQSLSLHAVIIACTLWFMSRRSMSWEIGFAHRRWTWLGGLGGGGVAYLAMVPYLFVYAILYNLWLRAAGHEAPLQDAIQVFAELSTHWQRIYFIFVAVVLAPVAEEFLFRGILLPALGRIWGLGAAIGISSILFALIHMHTPSLVPLLVLSVGLSFAYVYSQSLLVPISMHMIFNAVSLVTVSILPH